MSRITWLLLGVFKLCHAGSRQNSQEQMQSSWLWHAPSWIPFCPQTSSSLDLARPCRPCMSKLTGTSSSTIPLPDRSTLPPAVQQARLHSKSSIAHHAKYAVCIPHGSFVCAVLRQQVFLKKSLRTLSRCRLFTEPPQVPMMIRPGSTLRWSLNILRNAWMSSSMRRKPLAICFDRCGKLLIEVTLWFCPQQIVLLWHWLLPSTQVYRSWSDALSAQALAELL